MVQLDSRDFRYTVFISYTFRFEQVVYEIYLTMWITQLASYRAH